MSFPYPAYIRYKLDETGDFVEPKEVEIDFHGILMERIKTAPTDELSFEYIFNDSFAPTEEETQEQADLQAAFEKLLLDSPGTNEYFTHILDNLPDDPPATGATSSSLCAKLKTKLTSLCAKLNQPLVYGYALENFIEEFADCLTKIKVLAVSSSPPAPANIKSMLLDEILPDALDIADIAVSTSSDLSVVSSDSADEDDDIVIDVAGDENDWDALRKVLEKVKDDLNTDYSSSEEPYYVTEDSSENELYLAGGDGEEGPEVNITAKRSPSGFTLTFSNTDENAIAFKRIAEQAPSEGLNMVYTVKECPGGEDGLIRALDLIKDHPKLKFAQSVIDQFTAEFDAAGAGANPDWDRLKAIFETRGFRKVSGISA